MNKSFLDNLDISNLFVQPASSDSGTALGAAYLAANEKGIKISKLKNVYLGNSFSEKNIFSILQNSSAKFKKVKNPHKIAAKLISKNKIVGWFQGRHEYGPRALGCRSILANPRSRQIQLPKCWPNIIS